MKAKSAEYKIKQAYKKWMPDNYTEFFQEVRKILREFEKSQRMERIDVCRDCEKEMTIRSAEVYCKNPYCEKYMKVLKFGISQ